MAPRNLRVRFLAESGKDQVSGKTPKWQMRGGLVGVTWW